MPKARVLPVKSAIPAGFIQMNTGNFPPIFDFAKAPILMGVMSAVKTVTTTDKKKVNGKWVNEDKETRIMAIANEETGELCSVWESAALSGLFDTAKTGDGVYMRYDGPIQIKGRPQPMKGFTTGLKPGDGREIVAPTVTAKPKKATAKGKKNGHAKPF